MIYGEQCQMKDFGSFV